MLPRVKVKDLSKDRGATNPRRARCHKIVPLLSSFRRSQQPWTDKGSSRLPIWSFQAGNGLSLSMAFLGEWRVEMTRSGHESR